MDGRINGPVEIDGQVCMGSGQLSMAACYHLHCRLEKAFSMISGIQQVSMAVEKSEVFKEYERHAREDEFMLDQIAKEICMGITGKKIKFIEPQNEDS